MPDIKQEEITGIILAGGKSSRMGKDKGLCGFKGKPLVSYAINTLAPLCKNLMISANYFPEKYAEYNFPVVEDEIKGIGPIGGILSCLKKSPTRHNLVLSCDTPFVSTDFFRYLLENIENYQVVAPSHETFLIEPLSAYYNTNVIADMEAVVSEKNFKLLNFFTKIRFKALPYSPGLPFYIPYSFININTPDDLERARRYSI